MPTHTCLRCGNPFEARTKRRRYCDGPCFRAHEAEEGRRRAARFTSLRRKAAILVQSAIYRGDLIRQPCEVCAKGPAVAHHDDYAKPLEVRWLCLSHHRQHHVAHGPGRNGYCDAHPSPAT